MSEITDELNINEYVETVYDNILNVTTGNAFKICNKIAFKDADEGIPVTLFLDMFQEILRSKILVDDIGLINSMLRFTAMARYDIVRKGANKILVFDVWVLNIRTLRG